MIEEYIINLQANVSPEAFQTIYEWMIFNGNESNKLLKRENILDLFYAAQYLAIKGIHTFVPIVLLILDYRVNLTGLILQQI